MIGREKGMRRLIDADALLLRLAEYQLQESPDWGANGYGNRDKYEAITNCIKTVEDAPVIVEGINDESALIHHELKMIKSKISRQAYKTIAGQIKAGDVKGASAGIRRMRWRIENRTDRC